MDPSNYYITTITNAFTKLAPFFIFLVGGYFVFIKLPFLFLKKSMDQQKKKLQEENKGLEVVEEKKYTVEDYKDFQRKMRLMNGQIEAPKSKEEPKKKEGPKKKPEQKKTEQKKAEPPPKKPAEPHSQSPEEVLGFKPNQSFTKSELKKRYFDKLKENHPDRVASMGEDFKKLAEKNTKEINKAYDKLKNRAA